MIIAQIVEIKIGMRGAAEPVCGADAREIAIDRLVAREHDVVAVVDHEPELGIVIRAAAATGARRGFVDGNGKAGFGQNHRRRQARKPRTNNMSVTHLAVP